MPEVSIALSGLKRGMAILEPLTAQLAAAFEPFGVSLRFSRNKLLTIDPEQVQGGWFRLVSDLHKQSQMKSPAHLVVTNAAPGFDGTIDGMLFDKSIRGVAGIYLDANLYGAQGAEERADLVSQICIHELGHLLNLTHCDGAKSTYMNAMVQSTERIRQRVEVAWRLAIVDAARRLEPPLLVPSSMIYYPFNAHCRANLRAASHDPRWLPFHGPLRSECLSTKAQVENALAIAVVAHDGVATSPLQGALYATLHVRNTAPFPVEVPAHLAPEYGTVNVTFEGDAGQIAYTPQRRICSSARRTLMPGERIERPLSIVGCEGAPVFTEPGAYQCIFEVTDPHKGSGSLLAQQRMDVKVVHDENRESQAQYLTALLNPSRRTMPSRRPRPADKISASALIFHATLARARRVADVGRRAELLRSCLHPDAPEAIRYGAAKYIALELIRQGQSWERVSDVSASGFSSVLQRELQTATRRMEEGWVKHQRSLREGRRSARIARNRSRNAHKQPR